ncbi:hypothetical protein CEQ90_01970 [Lewinellaceae bacterium SD302]|nr:hypothetical protein CEQ90_01970 [Lewinellaceae bacterium SD302]
MRKFKLLFTLVSMMLIGTGGLFAQPANDLCDDAQPAVSGDVFVVNTTTATGTGFPGFTPGGAGAGDPGVWYSVSGTEGLVTVNTCGAGTTFDTRLTAFTGSCADLGDPIAANDDFCGLQSQISFFLPEDQTAYVYVSGFGGGTGTAEVAFDVVNVDNTGSDDIAYFTRNNAFERIDLATGGVFTVGIMSPNPGFVSAGEILSSTGVYYAYDNDSGDLITIDTGDATIDVIAPLTLNGADIPVAIQSDPSTGEVYVVGVDGNTLATSTLYTLDTATAAVSVVGTANAGAIIGFGINSAGDAFGIDIVGDAVYEFNLNDFSIVNGPTPLTDMDGNPIDINFGQDIDFDFTTGNNFLYGILYDNVQGARRFGVLDPASGMFTDLPSTINGPAANVGSFSVLSSGGFDCEGEWTVDLSAITNINVTLDDDCTAKLVARQVLIGDYDTDDEDGVNDPAPNEAFEIVVQDDNPSNGNIIDGCGTFIWTAVPFCPDSVLMGFTSAWGYVNAEDKISPELVDSLTPRIDLFCTDLDIINVSTLPNTVDRCWIQDGSNGQLVSDINPLLLQALQAGGGRPIFFDGCSDVEICVNDLVQNNGQCNDLVITRVFRANDGLSCESVSGEENPETVYSYDIVFTTPSVDSVVGVDSLAEFSCSDNFPTLPANVFGDENPAPAADDFPFLDRGMGIQVFLSSEGFCNLGAAFQDGPRIVTCDDTYKFVRTFTVIDWCDVNNIRTFTQLVKVGDFEAPTILAPTQDLNFDGIPDVGPLFFSTNTPDCESVFVVPAGSATDNCDATPTVTAVVYPGGDTLAIGFGPFPVGLPVSVPIPAGEHVIRYFAVDNCGNISTLDRDIVIGDQTAPVAICEDGLNISIGGPNDASGGTAEICADDVNRASYDDCSDIGLDIRVTMVNGVPVSPVSPLFQYQECHTLRCSELGTIEVELRVTDDANEDGVFQFGVDNTNFCWLDVLVEDKTPPICIAPGPVTIECADLDEGFPQDLNIEFALDPVGTAALLDAQFNTATGLDNCPDPVITQTVADNRNSCGVGTIIRTFTVTDAQNFTSPPGCMQIINVIGIHDYTVVFPGDEESDDCVEPDYNGVSFTENGCDLITVSATIDTFTASADECYKLRVNYEVLNWCEYNTIDAPYAIPRDADGDGILAMDTTVLHIVPNGFGLDDDVAVLDRDVNRNNFNTIGNLDTGDGGVVTGTDPEGYGEDGSRGAFTYFQFIKVYDDNPPTLVVVEPDSAFCSFTNECEADVQLMFSIMDECSPLSVNAEVSLDQFIGAGVYTLADFNEDVEISDLVTNNGDGTFDIDIPNVPIGRHAVRIRATDGCGNTSVDLIVFEVTDCKAPTPICINGLTATLMPDGMGGGMAAIWASDFIASPSFDCSGDVFFAIYRDGEQPAVGNISPQDTGLVLDCDDLGPLAVRIYAVDPFGQADYCLTMLLVQAFNPTVCTNGDGELAGVVSTPADDMMNGVTVNITSDLMADAALTTNGLYQFTSLDAGNDYTVEPTHNPAINLGNVTTADLIMISRHILGLEPLTGEYQLLAANANQDANVNILDIIAIRRVILGLDNSFQATNSWRFYVSGDDSHAETFTQNNLEGSITGVDFVAVEMGNVTDASADFQGPDSNNSARSTMGLNVQDIDMKAGNTYEVNFTAADMIGFQGTLELGAGVQLVDVTSAALEAGNFNLTNAAQGLIAVSYNGEAGDLFTLTVRATNDAQLSDVLNMTDRITAAEAYGQNGEVANLDIDFTNGVAVANEFALEQNTPNPFADVTKIGYNLPTAATATLTVQDIQGRVLLVREFDAAAGYNTIELEVSALQGATGVMTYTLVAGEQSATRKLVVLK